MISTGDKNSLVFQGLISVRTLRHLLEGSMRLYEVLHRQWDLKALAQFLDSFTFMLSTTIGEKDERDMVIVEVPQGLCGTWNR